MTGIKKDEQDTVLKFGTSDFDLSGEDAVQIGVDSTSRPIPSSLLLMPDEAGHYDSAMQKAMRLAGDDVTALVGREVEDYNSAMRSGMGSSAS